MQQGITHKEAVRLAKEKLGEVTAEVMAAYIQENFGLAIKPPFVTVLLGSLQERVLLQRSGQAAYEKIERWKAENPEEAKKLAAAAKRREALRQRKVASDQATELLGPGGAMKAPAVLPVQATPEIKAEPASDESLRGKAEAHLEELPSSSST